ncbi:RDD family protein [Flavobacterium sp. ANB]|uniref:RDD family protein n=1 Tax=unclassified Flavobacterium TaxID=196869 RepID=UPI0012B7682F|nr:MULTISPECIES: RDD family protein [unclassified Flavobacterium]MBF4514853.1 RDD family protein [Flavobacterium sp. ANB]MTD68179.1 RDD family protein [Flavobacterium sp. LC2016-13]
MSNSTYILDDKLFASNGSRFLNYILDLVAFVIIFFLFCIALGIFIGLIGKTDWITDMGELGWNLIAFTLFLLYYTLLEGFFGRSIGKFITGTILVDENGQRPSFGTVFKRSLCRLIPFDAFSFLGSDGRGWHDTISDTYVVNKKALEEEVKTFHEFSLIGAQETN